MLNITKALRYAIGALRGDVCVRMIMGYHNWTRITIPVSCENAKNFYWKVANKVAKEVSLRGQQAVQRVRLLD